MKFACLGETIASPTRWPLSPADSIRRAAWSPGGNWLVFGSNRDGNWNLYLLPAAGAVVDDSRACVVEGWRHPVVERALKAEYEAKKKSDHWF